MLCCKHKSFFKTTKQRIIIKQLKDIDKKFAVMKSAFQQIDKQIYLKKKNIEI